MKKFEKKGDTMFCRILPKWNKKLFSQVYLTVYTYNNKTSIKKFEFNEENIFSDLYINVKNHIPEKNYTKFRYQLLPTDRAPEIKFHVLLDKILKNNIFALQHKNMQKEDNIDEYISMENLWYKSADGSIFKYENGKKIDFNQKSQNSDALLTFENKCAVTQFLGDRAECEEFIHKCILEGKDEDVQTCLAKFNNLDFNKVIISEFKNMHPLVAIGLLKRLGFKTKNEMQSNGTTLVTMESVSHWAKRFIEERKEISPKNYNTFVTNNMNLIKYLNVVVQYVNGNPGILNPEYAETKGDNKMYFKGSDFACKLGIKRREIPMCPRYYSNIFGKNFKLAKRIMQGGCSNLYPFIQMKKRLCTPFGTAFVTPNKSNANNCSQKSNYDYLYNIIKVLRDELAHKGKNIEGGDIASIEKLIEDHKRNEDQIHKIISVLEIYNNHIDMYSNYTSETLTLDNIRKIADIFKNRLNKRENLPVKSPMRSSC